MQGTKAREILIGTDNRVGKLAEVAGAIKDSGINIKTISAWAADSKAFFRLVTSDNFKAKEVLQGLGDIEEKEVVLVDLPDEVGRLAMLVSRLKNKNVDLNYIYGTTSEHGKSAIIVFSSNDNDAALEVISDLAAQIK